MTTFPAHMPNTGSRVDSDPANMLRDVFLANRGRIPVVQVDAMVSRHTFTYGADMRPAWERVRDEYLMLDGNDWVWPIQEAMA